MSAAPVSVIVVSRGRPALLSRCLTGIGQLCHPAFEVIVVADAMGLGVVAAMGWSDRIKTVGFEAANISEARNAGLAVAAGEIVAFIDDDAVPEPSWLDHLTAPFADPDVSTTGGYVLARNGISFQWRARAVDAHGRAIALDPGGEAPFEPEPPAGFVTKTEGTNMAFRRDALARIGGFDPAFRFFLDETDLNLRLAAQGGRTFLVPLALVHHGYAASDRRRPDRAPRDLTEIGASTAVFLRKHATTAPLADHLHRLRADQRKRLIGHMIDGGLEPGDIARLLAGLEAGFVEGSTRPLAPLAPIGPVTTGFQPFHRAAVRRETRLISGRFWSRHSLDRAARAAVEAGDIVTVIRLSPTMLPHRIRFVAGGWWLQTGGLFGRSDRQDRSFRWWRFRARVRHEWARVAKLRQCRELS